LPEKVGPKRAMTAFGWPSAISELARLQERPKRPKSARTGNLKKPLQRPLPEAPDPP